MQAEDLAFTPITRQAELVRSGEIAPRELVETYLERIERLDPTLNAFRVVMAERALVEAQQAEARRKQGDQRPLLGVPVAIKDDTDVAGEVTGDGVDQLSRRPSATPKSSGGCAPRGRSSSARPRSPS